MDNIKREENARIINWLKTGIKRETYRLAKKRKTQREFELLILNRPSIYIDENNIELLNLIPSNINTFNEVYDKLYIEEIFKILTIKQKIIIKKIILEGYSEKELAQRLCVSQAAIHKIKIRALKKILKNFYNNYLFTR